MDDSVKNILDVLESTESRINSYWNFYVVVVVATIGWLMSSQTPFTSEQGVVLTVSICLFFAANFAVLRAATKRAVAYEAELKCVAAQREFQSDILLHELASGALKYRLPFSYLLHAMIDVAVLYAIWSKLG